MADSPILPGSHQWKLVPSPRGGTPDLPPEFFRFFRDLVTYVAQTQGNTASLADILARLDALEAASTNAVTGQYSVQTFQQDAATIIRLLGDIPAPNGLSYYGTDENGNRGWLVPQPGWVPNPYADYLVDENGDYLTDENGNFLSSGDPDPQFDTQGSAAAALSAANAYTDDVVPSAVLYCDAINGRVGVGTTSPTFQFHVEGSTAGLYLNRTGGSESFIALAMGGTTQGQLRADTSGYLKITNALGSTELIRLGTDLGVIGGRLFGTALHNNAGGMAGTASQYVGSGTYTPTLTNTANIDASTPQVFQYTRTGNVVTVSGSVNIDPTAATTLTTLGISLPIPSDLNSYVQCCGTAVSRIAGAYGEILGDPANDRATLNFTNGASTGNSAWFLTFTYLVR